MVLTSSTPAFLSFDRWHWLQKCCVGVVTKWVSIDAMRTARISFLLFLWLSIVQAYKKYWVAVLKHGLKTLLYCHCLLSLCNSQMCTLDGSTVVYFYPAVTVIHPEMLFILPFLPLINLKSCSWSALCWSVLIGSCGLSFIKEFIMLRQPVTKKERKLHR